MVQFNKTKVEQAKKGRYYNNKKRKNISSRGRFPRPQIYVHPENMGNGRFVLKQRNRSTFVMGFLQGYCFVLFQSLGQVPLVTLLL